MDNFADMKISEFRDRMLIPSYSRPLDTRPKLLKQGFGHVGKVMGIEGNWT